MDRRRFLGLSGAVTATATFAPRAFAQAKMVLKAADAHPLGYPTVEAVVRMGKSSTMRPRGGSRFRCTRRCSSAARRR